jgi:mono/diheme cytochrome c family protein
MQVFRVLRTHRQATRWLAALLVLVWLSPLALPHAADDDLLCAPVSASTDVPATWTAAAGGDPQAHHCVICHSVRSFRSALADCGPAAVNLTAENGVDASADVSRRAPALDRLLARAPPA